MALNSLDDHMLGEKVDYYCSSSEDEDDNSQIETENEPISKQTFRQTDGYQTGPKGVIEDLRQYKKLESEQNELKKIEYKKLVDKYAITCDGKANNTAGDKNNDSDDDDELLKSLEDDQFMELYHKKRMAELKQQFNQVQTSVFGSVMELNESNYIEAIDDEKPFVTVLIHIYEKNVRACEALNGCFEVLAERYETVKFCRIEASAALLSRTFRAVATPAIIAYRNKTVIGNFISLSETFGDDFFAPDVEAFLNSHDLLPSS